MQAIRKFELAPEWVSVVYTEKTGPQQEVYGYAEANRIGVEGVRFLPKGRPSKTLVVYMHPAATFTRLPVPRALAQAGLHVLCAESRYTRNDTPLVMEKVISDYGAFVRHAREVWGYERIVVSGWSGGGSLTALYQSQAEKPTIVDTPAGDPIHLGELIPGDALLFHAAHLSRAEILSEFIDPSVIDESNPDVRRVELDLYDPRNPNWPPYSKDYVAHFRAEQLARVRRRTAYAKEMLEQLRKRGGAETERAMITHRTLADPRFLDGTIDPNDRKVGTSFMGNPEAANVNPAGIARFSTLRAWLSQWSVDDSRAQAAKCAPSITVPVLAIENTADDAVPQPHVGTFLRACASRDKTMKVIQGANHYYAGQDEMLAEVVTTVTDWLEERRLLD
jgi:dienelactone hydrolase